MSTLMCNGSEHSNQVGRRVEHVQAMVGGSQKAEDRSREAVDGRQAGGGKRAVER